MPLNDPFFDKKAVLKQIKQSNSEYISLPNYADNEIAYNNIRKLYFLSTQQELTNKNTIYANFLHNISKISTYIYVVYTIYPPMFFFNIF